MRSLNGTAFRRRFGTRGASHTPGVSAGLMGPRRRATLASIDVTAACDRAQFARECVTRKTPVLPRMRGAVRGSLASACSEHPDHALALAALACP